MMKPPNDRYITIRANVSSYGLICPNKGANMSPVSLQALHKAMAGKGVEGAAAALMQWRSAPALHFKERNISTFIYIHIYIYVCRYIYIYIYTYV